ncbi:MAG: nitrate reductase [Synechococcus sp. TMED187]|uniref:nitrate reductase associated protein n=1 Tax=Synechococcus sp. UW105 TaxID=337067 RepID=UPI000B7149D8|nr:nitrate reductase associated protein [Synechococcus sp. UW105]OUW46884.1 MAG: nitrate reductase [Synechococcus sp. TMED187]RZO13041.1 MAG: nitrate reductase [Synechococcus sp. MED-G135]
MGSHHNSASHCFAFEQDFIGNWRCIPLCVRRKLDLIGLKLKLNHWLALSQVQRQELVDWPDASDALEQLREHLRSCTSGMAEGMAKDLLPIVDAAWQQADRCPAEVLTAAATRGVGLTPAQWSGMSELERFALCKLVRPGHDHHNLEAAFSEVLA